MLTYNGIIIEYCSLCLISFLFIFPFIWHILLVNMQKLLLQIGTIYLAGVTGLYKGVPVGIALKAHPALIAALTALGSISAVLVINYSGTSFRKWILSKVGKDSLEKKKGRFTHLMDRYGVIGLGLIASGTIGPIATILLGLITLKETSGLMVYLIIGIILWSIGLTAIAVLGVDAIKAMILN